MGVADILVCSRFCGVPSGGVRGECAALLLDLRSFFMLGFIGLVDYLSQVVTENNITNENEKKNSCQSRKPVLDFLRIVLMDSLLNISANSNTHPVILLLQVSIRNYLLINSKQFFLVKIFSVHHFSAKNLFLQKVPLYAKILNMAEWRHCGSSLPAAGKKYFLIN